MRGLWLMAIVGVGLLGAWLLAGHPRSLSGALEPDRPQAAASASAVEIGGPFTLTDQAGRTVTDRTLWGKPSVIFFGFTSCPEVCPTTLAAMTGWLAALGPDAERLNVVFITVDPERDTPAILKAYLSSFDPRIRGLTGTPAQVAQAARGYRIYSHKTPLPGGGYTVDHSSAAYLMDAAGHFSGVIGYGEGADRAVARLRQLLKS